MKTIDRLENILAEYEDLMWLLRLIIQTKGDDVSHIPKPEALRDAMNERGLEGSMKICEELSNAGESFKYAADNASDLADWCYYSKRVFSISESLSEMLLATELPDFSLDGIKFVSQAFVVRLEKPVQSTNGRVHDFILCSFCPNTGALSLRSYSQVYESYHPISAEKKRLAEKDARRKNPRFEHFIEKLTRQSKPRFVIGYTCYLANSGSLKERVIAGAPPGEKDDWELIYKLALGVNLYLQSARGNEDVEEVSEVKRARVNKAQPRPITDGAKLFELSVSTSFSSHQSNVGEEEKTGWSVRPHFRKGFWRRPSGLGHDPTAQATIWVRPTWVRKDLIEAGEKPIGSFQTVQE